MTERPGRRGVEVPPEDLIDRIYEAAAAPGLWEPVLHDLAVQVGSAGAILLTRRSDAWTGWRISREIESGADVYLRSDAALQSETTARLLAANRQGFVADHELFSEAEYASDPFMTEWAAPNGLQHGAAAGILIPGGDFAVVQVQRRKGRPPYAAAELAALDALRPHLARAAMLAARWRLQRLSAMTEALAMLGLPAAVLDGGLRVVAANDLMEGLRDWIIWAAGDRLGFHDASASERLKRAATAPPAMAATSFPVQGMGLAETIAAHVAPVSGEARDLFAGGMSLLVLTPLSPMAPDPGLIQGLFDLTDAEARIASSLGQGLSPNVIAARRGVALGTVRSQIKDILAKTGCRRQSELAAKLARTTLMARPGTSGSN
jgi:DNA-binding CsgD family transcriptional regulator